MPLLRARRSSVRSRHGTPVAIRNARKSDVDDLARVEVAAFRSYYRPHRFDEQDFLRYLARPNTLALVACVRDTVVGYALGPAPVSGHPRTARLDSIAVLPAERGRGIGRRLLKRFMINARTRGCHRVSLEVAVPNAEARRLFEEAAFRPTRTLAGYYSGTADAIRLRAGL